MTRLVPHIGRDANNTHRNMVAAMALTIADQLIPSLCLYIDAVMNQQSPRQLMNKS